MRNILKHSWLVIFLSVFCFAQNNTNLLGNLLDSDGQSWINAGWTAQLQIPGGGGKAQFRSGGAVPLTNNGLFNFAGAVTPGTTLPNNAQILPTGTTWKICISSATSAPQQCFVFPVTGTSIDFGTKLSSLIKPPRIEAAKTNYAYNSTEIINPVAGTGFINTITGACNFFTASGYISCGSSGTAQLSTANTFTALNTFTNEVDVQVNNSGLISGVAITPGLLQGKTSNNINWTISTPTGGAVFNTIQAQNKMINSAGFQIVTGPGCTSSAAVLAQCVATMTLPFQEPDALYTVTGCTITPVNGIIGNVGAGQTSSQFTLAVYAGTASGITGGTISCLVVHN